MDANQLCELVIAPTLDVIELNSDVAVNLLVGTVFQESSGGEYLKQLGGGPALGIYQIEPNTHTDVWENYLDYRASLTSKVEKLLSPEDKEQQLISNLSYATAIARIIYYRKPQALPTDANDVQALGEYWKEHYNTAAGAGTVEEFVANFPTSVLS